MWQNKVILASSIFCTIASAQKIVEAPFIESSPREELRKKLFEKNISERSCLQLESTLSGEIKADPSLSAFVSKLLNLLNQRNIDALAKEFHERLKMRPSVVEKSLTDFEVSLGKPIQFTLSEVFALNSPTGVTAAISCDRPKDQTLKINPQFGYPLQLSVWIQAMGQKELGRLHIGIVPDRKNQWKVGLWQQFQWTHDQKDFVEFAKMADAYAKENRPELAYVAYSASEKFLLNLGFVEFGAFAEIKDLKDKIMSSEQFSQKVKALLKDAGIKFVTTNYIEGGLAVVIRKETKEEVSLVQVKEYCAAKAALLAESKEFKGGLTALRCGYVLPKEDPAKDGVLGSYLQKF